MSRAPVAGALLLLTACGAGPVRVTEPAVEDAIEDAGGVRVLALPRPTAGVVWLSLWVDAGARDASPAQVATLAAWSLDPSARALADGLELRATIRPEDLPGRLDAWAERLRAPVDADAVASARRRLTEARAAASQDRWREVDRRALTALLGADPDPLGRAEDDEAASEEAVRAFREAHVGAGRLLLVAIGDVEPEALRREAARAFGGLARASAGRRQAEVAAGTRLEVGVGEEGLAAIASAHPDVGRAADFARRLIARLRASGVEARTSGDAFPLRGHGVAVVRVAGAEDALVGELVGRARELREEDAGPAEVAPPIDGAGLAAWHGARWASGDGAPEAGLGLGVVVDGGRGDDLSADDPDAAALAQARARLAALTQADGPALEGSVEADRVDARLPNGAQVIGRRVPGMRRAAAAVVFAGGAEEEAAGEHGVTAVLAMERAIDCGRRATEELGRDPSALGIRIAPIVRAGAWGLLVDGPAERAPQLTSLAARCGGGPPPPAHLLSPARDRAAALGDLGRAQLARALAPGSPGRLAPLGDPAGLTTLSAGEVRRWSRRMTVGRRARLAVIAPDDLRGLAGRAARAMSAWPAGDAPQPVGWTPPSGVLAGPPSSGPRAGAWIVWSAEAAPAEAGVEATFEAQAAESLARAGELTVIQTASGHTGGRAWVAAEVRCAPDALEGLPQRTAEVSRAVGAALRRGVGRVTPTPGASAAALAVTTALAGPPDFDAGPGLERLRRAAPVFVIARPRPEP